MSRPYWNTTTGSGEKRVRSRWLGLWGTLDLLLIGASIVLIVGSSLWGPCLKRVAAADGDGGSTVPIPPPDRPTPRTTNATLSEAGVLIEMTLADLDLRILPEAEPVVGQHIVFPFPPSPESGTNWQKSPPPGGGGLLTIPLGTGQIPGDLRVKLGPLQVSGQEATALILGIQLAIGPLEVEGTGAQLRTVRLSAELDQLPTNVVISVRGVPSDSEIVAAVNEAAGIVEMGVVAIAYAARIDTNLTDEITLASIEMTVEKRWAEAWPMDRILIARIGQDGKGRILEAAVLSEDASRSAQFRAEFEEGFSTFVLMALEDMITRESRSGPSSALWFGMGLGAVGVMGLAIGSFILVSSRERKPGA